MFRRLLKGRSPFAPDREHFHHVLILAGYSVTQSVAIMAGLSLTGVAIGLLGNYLGPPDIVMFYLFLSVFALYFWGMMRAWKVMRFLHRSICRRRNGVDRRLNPDRRKELRSEPQIDFRVNGSRRAAMDRRSLLSSQQV